MIRNRQIAGGKFAEINEEKPVKRQTVKRRGVHTRRPIYTVGLGRYGITPSELMERQKFESQHPEI